MVLNVSLPQSFERIVEIQIVEIERQLKIVEERLSELGESDEERVEKILLEAVKRHLLNDLKALVEYSQREGVLSTSATVPRTVVET